VVRAAAASSAQRGPGETQRNLPTFSAR
jgi:hypothetical protein